MKKLLIHPLFIYAIISYLSCLTHENIDVVYHDMPKIGDNFKTPNSPAVYYFDGKGKFSYKSIECFKSKGNPDFGTKYEFGGIKCVDENINSQIPLLGKMCDSAKVISKIEVDKPSPPLKVYLDKNVLLDKFSEIAHFLCYTLLAMSLMNYFKSHKKRILYTFGVCFLGGVILEIIQGLFISGRHCSWEDVVLNCIGCGVGNGIYTILKKYF